MNGSFVLVAQTKIAACHQREANNFVGKECGNCSLWVGAIPPTHKPLKFIWDTKLEIPSILIKVGKVGGTVNHRLPNSVRGCRLRSLD